jgi:hypothetical protein
VVLVPLMRTTQRLFDRSDGRSDLRCKGGKDYSIVVTSAGPAHDRRDRARRANRAKEEIQQDSFSRRKRARTRNKAPAHGTTLANMMAISQTTERVQKLLISGHPSLFTPHTSSAQGAIHGDARRLQGCPSAAMTRCTPHCTPSPLAAVTTHIRCEGEHKQSSLPIATGV